MEEVPCRAFFSAARWNGHAAHSATGAAQATSVHCQPGNRTDGTSDKVSDRSVSGTKKMRATISRRRRYAACRAAAVAPSSVSAVSAPAASAPAASAPAVAAVEPVGHAV